MLWLNALLNKNELYSRVRSCPTHEMYHLVDEPCAACVAYERGKAERQAEVDALKKELERKWEEGFGAGYEERGKEGFAKLAQREAESQAKIDKLEDMRSYLDTELIRREATLFQAQDAIKERQAEVDTLKAELAALESELGEFALAVGYGKRSEGQPIDRAALPVISRAFIQAQHKQFLEQERAERAEAALAIAVEALKEFAGHGSYAADVEEQAYNALEHIEAARKDGAQ